MQVLVVDVGGNHVKLLLTGQTAPRKFASRPAMTAARRARQLASPVLRRRCDPTRRCTNPMAVMIRSTEEKTMKKAIAITCVFLDIGGVLREIRNWKWKG
jgi:hypothetical protein